jgi:hypothetical protein
MAKIDKLLKDREDFIANALEFERAWTNTLLSHQASADGTFGPRQAIVVELIA